MNAIDYHLRKQALTGEDNECGDTGIVKMYGGMCLIALVDVLGHGKEAFDVALMAEAYLVEHYAQSPIKIMSGLHTHLEKTRGAVAFVSNLNLTTGVLTYCGMGNISARVMGNDPRRLYGKDGILGYRIPSPVEEQLTLYPGDVLILCSDGVKTHFNPVDFPEILMGNAKKITAGFIDQLGKKNDDASCIAMRYAI